MAKVILVVFAIGFVAVLGDIEIPAELKEIATKTRAECMEETGATQEMIENTRKGEFSDNPRFKCYFKCAWEKLGLIENDNINFDGFTESMQEERKEKTIAVITICRETNGTDLCEKAMNFQKCFYQNKPEHYFVF